ncbi:MAG: hypothetical protein R3F43_15010 [bacterium]
MDHSILLFFKDGKSLRYVHEVLAIRSRDAAERFGEIGLPDRARLITLGTRKDDGRWLPGEEVAEKETITLPDLASGDYVVARYLSPPTTATCTTRATSAPGCSFEGDLPIFHQRFEVYSPDDVPPLAHGLAGAPAPTPVKLGERAGLRFDVQRSGAAAQRTTPRRPLSGCPRPGRVGTWCWRTTWPTCAIAPWPAGGAPPGSMSGPGRPPARAASESASAAWRGRSAKASKTTAASSSAT